MKKFFKALALVLALALVIGVVPAQATSAKVKAAKQLYVDGAKGESTDGKKSAIKSKVAIYKLAGYTKETKEGHKFAAELQKDNGVVEVGKRYVTARKLGKAKVDIYVDGEKVGTTTIISKVNATDASVELLCSGEKMPEEFVVGGTYTFTLPRVDRDSYERRLYINGNLVADDEGAPRTYTVTFKKSDEGKVTFKYEAYQSAKLDKAMVSKEYTAKVVPPKAESIKQTKWDTFEITFEGDIEKGGYYKSLKDWETEQDGVANDVYYKISGVRVPFSSVKATTPKENVLTVKMYGAFVPDTEYFVNIAGTTLSFVAAGNKAKDVTDIVFTSDKVLVSSNADIPFKLVNKAGIDITETALADTSGSLSFLTTDTTKATIFDKTIYFYKAGDTAKVTGTFTYYDADDGYKAYPTTNSTTLTAVESAAAFVSAEYSIADLNVEGEGANNNNRHGNGRTYLPVGDLGSYVNVRAKFLVDGEDAYVKLGETIPVINKQLRIAVADEHYAMLTSVTSAGEGVLQGVKTGKTSFILYYTTDDGKAQPITSLPFEVKEARKATFISASAENVNTGLPFLNTDKVNGTELTDDAIAFTVTLVDQYQKEFDVPLGRVTFTERNGSATSAGAGAAVASFNDIAANAWHHKVLNGTQFGDYASEKVVSYDVKAEGLSTVVSFRVKAAGNYNDDSTIVAFASGNSIDTAIVWWANDTYCQNKEAHLNYMNGNYYAGRVKFYLTDLDLVTNKDLADYAALVQGDVAAATSGAIYVAKILHGSTTLTAVKGGANGGKGLVNAAVNNVYRNDRLDVNNVDLSTMITLDTASRAHFEIDFDAFNGGKKLHSGSYTVMFYEIYDENTTDDACRITPIGSKIINVTDSQTLPSVAQKKQTIATLDLAGLNSAYTFKWNNIVRQATVLSNYKENGMDGLYVYDVVIELPTAFAGGEDATGYRVVVPVGELLNKQ